MGLLRDELDRMWGGGPFPRLLDYVHGNLVFGGETVFYLQDDGSKSGVITQIEKFVPSAFSIPVSAGSLHSSSCSIVAPTGERFNAASYWGDKAGWRARIERIEKASGWILGHIKDDRLDLNDGRSFHLNDCQVILDLSKDEKENRIVRWPQDDEEAACC